MKLRTVALAAISSLCAACIGFTGDPTVAPSAPSTVTPSGPSTVAPSPTPSPFDFASFTPFPVATATPEACPTSGDGWDATLELGTATGVVSIPLDDGVTVPPPSGSIAPIDPGDIAIEGTVIGGTKLRADLVLGSLDNDPSIAITAVTARFIPLDASASAPVVPALDGTSIGLTLPDKRAVGRLLVQVDWSSRCGSGSAGGATALTVEPSSVVLRCPTTDEGIMTAVRALADTPITIGGTAQHLDIYGWSARWVAGANGVDDYGTLFPNWNRDVVITVAPGANVAVREKVDQLQLVSVRASIYTRADVDAYFAPDSTQDVDPLTVVRRNANPNGNVNIPAPLQPGTYVFDIDATWLTSCFELQTTRTVSVRVR